MNVYVDVTDEMKLEAQDFVCYRKRQAAFLEVRLGQYKPSLASGVL